MFSNAEEISPSRKRKKSLSDIITKNVNVLKQGQVRESDGEVYMPTSTIEMSIIKRLGQSKKVSFTASTTASEMQRKLEESFNFLSGTRFSCAKTKENRSKLDFLGERHIWSGEEIMNHIKWNSALYVFCEEENPANQLSLDEQLEKFQTSRDVLSLSGKHGPDWWKQSASFEQNSALSGQATDALNDGCEEKPSADDPLFAYGYEDLMQFFDMMKCLSEENCSQHLANTEKWIQLSRVVCKIHGQLGHGQNLLHDHLALCRESEENYFADAENSSCESSHFDSVSLSDSKDCGGSINGDGGTHGDELELYSDPRCKTSFVDSTQISHLDATGQGSECKSLLLVEEVEKKEGGQDPRPTNISASEKVESWLQSVCSANGLPFLSPGVPESLDTVHNDTLTLLNSVESARAIIEGREERKRDTDWWSKTGKRKGGEGEEQISRRDWAKKDYKVEKWLKVVCAANGVSPCEVTSFVSRSVPSSLEAAHDDELLLLEGLETVRAKSSSSGEKKYVRPFKDNHRDVRGQAEA